MSHLGEQYHFHGGQNAQKRLKVKAFVQILSFAKADTMEKHVGDTGT